MLDIDDRARIATMTKRSLAKTSAPAKHIAQIGQNIQIARKRRQMTQKELADRMLCSVPTVGRLEAGDPGISLSVLAQALWVMGMVEQLTCIASPTNDTVGQQEEMRRLPKKIRKTESDELNF